MTTSLAICVPAYNAAAQLPRLFESVRRQTASFDEVWVYDDASNDDTSAVASRLGARVVRGQINQGCSAGKNALLALVGTEWVHFHDADDTLEPEFVARAKVRTGAGGLDVLLLDYEQVDGSTGARMSRSDFGSSSLLEDPVRYNLIHTVNNGGVYSVPFLRQVGGFDLDPAVRHNEDRAFHLRLAEAGARFAVESYVGSRFFFSPASMSASSRAHCCLASHVITQRFAARNPGRYLEDIGNLAWRNAAGLASSLEWAGADSCVKLACSAGGRVPREASALFKTLCLIDPCWAIRVREWLIRTFKPRFRRGYPGWRMPALRGAQGPGRGP
jgi:glycosyltransferase involved in cell wall biosynthesis